MWANHLQVIIILKKYKSEQLRRLIVDVNNLNSLMFKKKKKTTRDNVSKVSNIFKWTNIFLLLFSFYILYLKNDYLPFEINN